MIILKDRTFKRPPIGGRLMTEIYYCDLLIDSFSYRFEKYKVMITPNKTIPIQI